MIRIYILDENEKDRLDISQYLVLFEYDVTSYLTSDEFLSALNRKIPDVAIISLDMSDTDGFQLLKTMKQKYDFPVIVITEKKSESDRILSFELGCEDYLIKPISKKELVLRINVIFRRMFREEGSEDHNLHTWKLRNSQLTQNTKSHTFSLDGEPLEFTNAEWRVLSYLSTNAGILLTREQIIDNCFDYRSDSYDRIVDTHIKNIRKMLGSYAQEWIETVRGYGYRFSGQPVKI